MINKEIKEIQNLDISEIIEELKIAKKELFILSIQKANGKEIKPHLIKKLQNRISQLFFQKSNLEKLNNNSQ